MDSSDSPVAGNDPIDLVGNSFSGYLDAAFYTIPALADMLRFDFAGALYVSQVSIWANYEFPQNTQQIYVYAYINGVRPALHQCKITMTVAGYC